MRIVIVGAGVAGCIMARTLAQMPGAEVTCLERVSSDDHSESGTGLNIGPNAVQALQWHDRALRRLIEAASLPWTHWRTSLTDGTVLFDLPLAQVANNSGWRIRWSELYRVLRDAAAPGIRYNCAITSVSRSESDPAQSAIEWTENGSHHRLDKIDLLIAADGRYSQIRRAMSSEAATRHVGVAISRVLVPDTSSGLIDDYEQWFNGPNRLLAFRVPPAHIYIAGAFPIAPEVPIPDSHKSAATLRALYTPPDRATSAQAAWLIDTICEQAANNHWARVQQHDVLLSDPVCNILYLGDAAHGMAPTLGQGATQAIEGACVAADVVTKAWADGRRSPRHWLRQIEQLRRDRIRFVMDFSLAATDTMLEGADPVAGTLHKTEADFTAKLARLYRDGPGGATETNSRSLEGAA